MDFFVQIPQILGTALFEGAVAKATGDVAYLKTTDDTDAFANARPRAAGVLSLDCWGGLSQSITETGRERLRGAVQTIKTTPSNHVVYRYCCPMLCSSERFPKPLPSTLCDAL